MSNPTVAEYTLQRLAALGTDKVLGVARSLNDAVEVMIPGEERQPPPDDVIDRGYKLRTPGTP